MEKLILIDGSNLIYRGFYAIPPFLKSPSGIQTNAVFGFATILIGLISSQKPHYVAIAFDKKGHTFRHKEFAEYKATRIKAPQELYDQIPLVKSIVETFKIPSFEAAGFEADDILATIVRQLSSEKDVEIFIATGDFDMFQVVSSQTAILYPTKGFKAADVVRTADVESKYKLKPFQIPDYKGIAGDASDNIPGVKGIGEKGAIDLLYRYQSLENIYKHLNELSPSLKAKLQASQNEAFMSKRLAILDENVPISFDLSACRVKHFDIDAAKILFNELGFKSLQKRLDETYVIKTEQESLF